MPMTTTRALTCVLAVLLTSAPSRGNEDSHAFDPVTGYRIAHYRAAVPDAVEGATRVDLDKVDALLKSGAILLDVMPSEGAGPDPVTGAWRLSRPHQTIPGATWLPDVGRGKISDAFEKYLAANTQKLTAGDKARPLIVFCQSDCWMAWNAVQRLAKLGYSALYWFPEGTDGWVEWGDRKLTPATPVPFVRDVR